ncbi:hypothetical protein ANCCAN_28199 [Ancylostoma caninum]|uniref:Uncharacterized protein n=1 Tax=Ancylostoma caninum TaxID=29170 RepID=A0A368F515_ANCCA|nr:hypothetical protein ANCCAN_28199 [Ancylostoma caninum]
MFIQHHGLSTEEVKHLEELMRVLYGTPPPITYDGHVRQLEKCVLDVYNRKRYFFCGACNGRLNQWKDQCEKRDCPLYRVRIKRIKSVERIEVHVLNVIPQISDVLIEYATSIIEFHRHIHQNAVSFLLQNQPKSFSGCLSPHQFFPVSCLFSIKSLS